MDDIDYYQVLSIDADADEQQIKKAYRRLALKYHPDKNSSADAGEKFRSISEAYEILSDPEKRRIYDTRGSSHPMDDDFVYHNPFAGFAFHNPEDVFAEFFNHIEEILARDVFGFMMQPPHPPPPLPPHRHHPFSSGFGPQFMGGGLPSFFDDDFMHPMLGGSFQQQSSSSSTHSGGYSTYVHTSTRNINGVTETVKTTKITDENGTRVIEERGDGSTKINGIEQPKLQQQQQIDSKPNNSRSSNMVLSNYPEKVQSSIDSEEEEEVDEEDQYDEHRDFFYREEQIRQEQLQLQQEQQRLWEEHRRHEQYMRQQQERMHQRHMMLHQQQMMQHLYLPFNSPPPRPHASFEENFLLNSVYGNPLQQQQQQQHQYQASYYHHF